MAQLDDLEVAHLIIYGLTGISACLLLTCAILTFLCVRFKRRAKELKRLMEEQNVQLAPGPDDALALPHRLTRSSVTEMDLNPIYNQLSSQTQIQSDAIPESPEYSVLQRPGESAIAGAADTSDYVTGSEAPVSSFSRATGGGTRTTALGMSTDSGAMSGHESGGGGGPRSTHKMALFFSNPCRDSGRAPRIATVANDDAAGGGGPVFGSDSALAFANKSSAYVETSETDGEDPYTPMTHFQQSRSNENVRYRVDVPRPPAQRRDLSDPALFNWSPLSTLPHSSVSRAHLSAHSSEISSIHPELSAKPGLADLAADGTASFPFRKPAERREVSRAATLPASVRHQRTADAYPPMAEHFRSGELLNQSRPQSRQQKELGQREETASYQNIPSGQGGEDPTAGEHAYWSVASAESSLTRLHHDNVRHHDNEQQRHGQEHDDWHRGGMNRYSLRPALQAAGDSPGRGRSHLPSDLRRSASVDNGQLLGIAQPTGSIGLRGRQISGLYGITPIHRPYAGHSPVLYDNHPVHSLQNLRQASTESDPHLFQYEYETPRFQERSAF